MVRDGIYYALAASAVGVLAAWFAGPWYGLAPFLLAGFFLWFFRDPERQVPALAGAVVSPADGRVTAVGPVELEGQPRTRISIFLNVFDVHVNRAPIAGRIAKVEYRTGKFHNAMGAGSAVENEQNVVTVEGDGETVVFKQIAGLLARRIVFWKAVGEATARGERVGLIKFGSRVDVSLDRAAAVRVQVGDQVHGGSSVLAVFPQREGGV